MSKCLGLLLSIIHKYLRMRNFNVNFCISVYVRYTRKHSHTRTYKEAHAHTLYPNVFEMLSIKIPLRIFRLDYFSTTRAHLSIKET